MKRLLVALPLSLFAGSAFAQNAEVPPDVYRDMWCATAYQQTIQIELIPSEDQPRAQIFLTAAGKMMERGVAGMTAAGFAANAVDNFRTQLLVKVATQVQQGATPEFEPGECDALMRELLPPDFLADQPAAQ